MLSNYLLCLAAIDLFKDKKVPDFISKNPIFQQINKLNKVFPHIGLKNFKEEIYLKKSHKDIPQYVLDLVSDLTYFLITSLPLIKENKQKFLETISSLLVEITPIEKSVVFENNIYKLVLQNDVKVDGKRIFSKGESLIKIYNKIKSISENLKINVNFPPIESLKSFKSFSKENIPQKPYYVVFSSEGEKGAYDIATMSERGISSCQSWSGSRKECLIGSIISKYVGIIYLTSGSETERGEKMMYRCIVRFGVEKDSKPVVMLDKMYPYFDSEVEKIFLKALKKHSKIDVISIGLMEEHQVKNIHIPPEEIDIPETHKSYMDVKLKQKEKKSKQIIFSEDIFFDWIDKTFSESGYSDKYKLASNYIKRNFEIRIDPEFYHNIIVGILVSFFGNKFNDMIEGKDLNTQLKLLQLFSKNFFNNLDKTIKEVVIEDISSELSDINSIDQYKLEKLINVVSEYIKKWIEQELKKYLDELKEKYAKVIQ